jgi:NhaA family Na+:H+ antiporter
MQMDAPLIRSSRLAPLLRPINSFLAAESASGVLLIASALVALIWANSRWGDSYVQFWHTKLAIGLGAATVSMSLEHWVNDGLMAIFFLMVGLEIKREMLLGELASPRRAALPMVAAVGGMVVPALIYAAFNYGGAGQHGWGIPMATDIAFAVGVLALVGRSVPMAIKVFLLAIAIVDDLGAVIVIALFYTGEISINALGVAGGFFAALVLLNLLRVHSPLPYLLLGIGLWAATLSSGIHATIAGVLLAFTIPATRQIEERSFLAIVRNCLRGFEADTKVEPDKITADQSHALKVIEEASQAVQTPLARVEHALLMPVSRLIVPIFALANAGVSFGGSGASVATSGVTWGVLLGLFIGKPIGVLLASWLAIKTGIAALPTGATWRQVVGVSILCGIGFTMALFVANLAFPGEADHLSAAKVGIFGASLLAGILGGIILWTARNPRTGGDVQAH